MDFGVATLTACAFACGDEAERGPAARSRALCTGAIEAHLEWRTGRWEARERGKS